MSERKADPCGPGQPPFAAPCLRMPGAGSAEGQDLHAALKTFHFTGHRTHPGLDTRPGADDCPAALTPFLEPGLRWQEFPFYLPAADPNRTKATPLHTLLLTALDDLDAAAGADVCGRHLWKLARAAADVLEHRGGSAPFRDVLAEAAKAFLAEVTADEEETDGLPGLWEQLQEMLPQDGTLLGLGPHTPLELYAATLRHRRRSARAEFLDEVHALICRLDDALKLERLHGEERTAPENILAALGEASGAYVDSRALADALPARRGTSPMDPTRRRRIAESAEVLKRYLDAVQTDGDFLLIHTGKLPLPPSLPSEAVRECPDPFSAAIELFDEGADALVPVLRALWVARLEAKNQYDPARHDEALAALDRNALAPQDHLLARTVAVLATDRALEGNALASYSNVLRSRRPIHLLILQDTMGQSGGGSGPAWEQAAPGLGYRSVAHREAFVVQSTMAEPEHLARGLADMASATRPAVALIGGYPWTQDRARAWLQATAEHQGRLAPCFRYAPGTGDSWAAGLTLFRNPQPRAICPSYPVCVMGDEGREHALPLRVGFAERAALDPASRDAFCIIPVGAWDAHQVELWDFLSAPAESSIGDIPFIWLADAGGMLQRAAVTRKVTVACRDYMRAWGILRELGDLHEAQARHAAVRARAAPPPGSSSAGTPTAPSSDVESLRQAVTEDTISRLVANLLGLQEETTPTADIASPAPSPAPPASAAGDAEPPTPVAQAAPIEEPYIDSALCTSCDDCINVNSRLFKYNGEKQAYIADVAAGTFAQLVKAAAACPAACIHPGAPRPGDTTATAKLLAKAAEFN